MNIFLKSNMLYAPIILQKAGINPMRRPEDLKINEWNQLLQFI